MLSWLDYTSKVKNCRHCNIWNRIKLLNILHQNVSRDTSSCQQVITPFKNMMWKIIYYGKNVIGNTEHYHAECNAVS